MAAQGGFRRNQVVVPLAIGNPRWAFVLDYIKETGGRAIILKKFWVYFAKI
jgi:hypothetical protein